MPGLTLTGFETLTIGELRDALNAAWRLAFGASMDVSDRAPDGQLIGTVAEPFAKLWELAEAIVSSQDRDKATGAALRSLVALTGTTELPPTFSAVTLTLTGTPTTIVPGGSLASTTSTEQQFETSEDATIAAATAWAGSTTQTAGDRRTNVDKIYLCTTGGTTAGSGGPTSEDLEEDIVDGTVHWRLLGAGTGYVDVTAHATVTGPIVAVSGDITTIDSHVGGWDAVINILDAALGRAAMTDAELRALQELEIARPGTSPKDAIRAALIDQENCPGVTSATLFVNNTDVTDGDGVPPHSVEALVEGGEDQDIWDTLLANVAAGIRTHGTEVGTALDSEGTAQPQAFSRPEDVEIYVAVTLSYLTSKYPADGDDQVKEAIATWGNAQDAGLDVIASALSARCFDVSGMFKVSSLLISAAPVTVPVSAADIVITSRQRAKFDTSRITVTSSSGGP